MPKLHPKADPIVGLLDNAKHHKKSSKKRKQQWDVNSLHHKLIEKGTHDVRPKRKAVATQLQNNNNNKRYTTNLIHTAIEMVLEVLEAN